MTPSYDLSKTGWRASDDPDDPSEPEVLDPRTIDPRYHDDTPPATSTPRQPDGEAVVRLLDWLVSEGTVESAGRKALLMSMLLGLPAIRAMTHAQLAAVLGVSRSRVTQLLTTLKEETSWDGMG